MWSSKINKIVLFSSFSLLIGLPIRVMGYHYWYHLYVVLFFCIYLIHGLLLFSVTTGEFRQNTKLYQTTTWSNRGLNKTAMKKHTCDFCMKRFSCTSHLVEHRRIHTGERPFICNFCNKGFTKNWNLRVHLQNHHT